MSSVRRNLFARGGAGITLALCFSLLTVLPGGATFATAAATVAADDLSPEVTEVTGETSGAEQFGSPRLPDQVAELPEGSDAVDPADVPGTAWADLTGVPVEVRAADEVTVLPESPDAAATTEPLPAAESEPVPVEVTVEPSGEGQTPALFVDIDKTTEAAAEPTLPGIPTLPEPTETPSATETPTDEPSATPSASGRSALEPDPVIPSDDPTETPTGTPTGEPTAEPTDTPTEVPAEELDGGDAVEVRISYADFRYAYGGDWGSRLRVMAYPSCFLTTPEEPECARGVEVPSVNDVATQTITFTTADLDATPFLQTTPDGETPEASPSADPSASPSESSSPDPTASPSAEEGTAGRVAPGAFGVKSLVATPAGSGGGTTYAVSASPAGQVGNFAAEPIKPSAAWQVGEGSGDFGYSYPFGLPAPAVGGAAPSLAASYSSGSVDGMNMAENGQASMMGLGWDLSTAYITREYAACNDDGHTGMDDLCWKTTGGELVTQYSIVLNGHSTRIVKDASSGEFRLQDDPGWSVGKFNPTNPGPTDPDNDDPNNEAFLVRTPDGTEYWFGWGHGSDSVLTVPVFGDDPSEPCNDSTIASSWCQQAWRWGLDKVIDRKGNVTEYQYAKVPNYYARFGDTSTAGRTVYDRDGYLTSITYGRSGPGTGYDAYSAVELTKRPRCVSALTSSTVTCTGSGDPMNNPDDWPDVPTDLMCASTGTCTNTTPSFFSTARYDKISTRRVSGSSVYDADTYQLNFQLPSNANDNPGNQALWLSSIQRTGLDGTNITLPKVVFEGDWLQNRVTVPYGGSKFLRLRVDSIRTETGARIDVEYGHDDARTCDPAYVDTLGRDDSIKECYPRKLVNDNWEWWHKYVVKRVGLGDDALGYRLGQAPDTDPAVDFARLRVYDYEYIGEPGWRYRPSPHTPAADETWDDWRGYYDTKVHTREVGTNQVVDSGEGDLSYRVVTRFRGLAGTKVDDDPNDNDEVRHDQITTLENTYDDHSWLNGMVAEEVSYAPNGVMLGRTSNAYQDYLTADWDFGLDSHHVYQSKQVVVPRTDAPARTTTWTVNDGVANDKLLGAVNTVLDNGGTPGDQSDDICTDTDWRSSASSGLRTPYDVITKSGSCASGTVIGHTVYYYDGDTNGGNSPTEGDANYTIAYADGSTPIMTKATWDTYGRPATQGLPVYSSSAATADAAKDTIFDYNPNGSPHGLLVSMSTTSPPPSPTASSGGELTSTQQFTFARGLVKDSGDANGAHTTVAYDGLGRPTDVWLPGRLEANPSMSFSYRDVVDNEGRVGTTVLRSVAGGTAVYDTTYEYSDGWGRPIQSSTLNQGGTNPRMATLTAYDEAGRSWLSVAPFAIGPVTEAVVPTLATTPHYSVSDFDAAGRPTKVAEKSNGIEKRWTKYTYTADADGVALMAGGTTDSDPSVTKTRTTYDAKFQVTSVSQYADGIGPNSNLDDGYASYTYTPAGLLASITTPGYKNGSNQVSDVTYTYAYDRLGRKTEATDPDTGHTEYEYDPMGNTIEVDDAMDNGTAGVVKTAYDRLSRPIRRESVVGGGSPVTLAEWTYDNAATYGKGRLAQTVSHTILGTVTTKVNGYDIRGNVTSTQQSYPGEWTAESTPAEGCTGSPAVCSKTTSFDHDELGNVVTTNYPAVPGLASRTVTTSYGKHGTFTGMTTPGVGQVPMDRTLAQVTYDELNRPLNLYSEPGPNLWTKSIKRLYTWSTDDRLTSLAAQTANVNTGTGATWFDQYKLSYVYDTAGNPNEVTGKRRDNLSPNTTYYGAWCYEYDGINRLTMAKTAVGTSTGTSCTTPAAGSGDESNTAQVTGQNYNLAYSYAQTRLVKVADRTLGATAQAAFTYPGTDVRPHAPAGLAVTGTGDTDGLPSPGALTYDAAGRATQWDPATGSTYDYTYDAQGNLTKADIAGTGGIDIVNAYDVDGIRVARKTITETVTYLAGAEITRPDASSAATSRRTYTTPGGTPLAIETTDTAADANTDPDWAWLFADAQDTIRFTKNADTGSVTTYAYYPYGDPISPTSPSTLPGERGYLNKPHDPDGTVRLDHRSYDPGLNTLITADPILTPTDPQNLNAYAYSRNNPIAFSDPTGLMLNLPDGSGGGSQPFKDFVAGLGAPTSEAPRADPLLIMLDISSSRREDPPARNTGHHGLFGSFFGTLLDNGKAAAGTVAHPIESAKGAWWAATNLDESWREPLRPLNDINTQKENGDYSGVAGSSLGEASSMVAGGFLFKTLGRFRSMRSGDSCSFAGATKVLLADGSRQPISSLERGDKVVATDPETGEQGPRRVIRVWAHPDRLVEVDIDGEAIRTTEDHPFWSVTDRRFERVDDLSVGEKLLDADGRLQTVRGLNLELNQQAMAFNLTVDELHTYHVGDGEFLVHNDCGPYKTREYGPDGERLTKVPAAPAWQTNELASYLGYRPTGRVDARKQMIYRNGNSYIVQDVDSHNGGFWKMANSVRALQSKTTRTGSYDFLLNKVGK